MKKFRITNDKHLNLQTHKPPQLIDLSTPQPNNPITK